MNKLFTLLLAGCLLSADSPKREKKPDPPKLATEDGDIQHLAIVTVYTCGMIAIRSQTDDTAAKRTWKLAYERLHCRQIEKIIGLSDEEITFPEEEK